MFSNFVRIIEQVDPDSESHRVQQLESDASLSSPNGGGEAHNTSEAEQIGGNFDPFVDPEFGPSPIPVAVDRRSITPPSTPAAAAAAPLRQALHVPTPSAQQQPNLLARVAELEAELVLSRNELQRLHVHVEGFRAGGGADSAAPPQQRVIDELRGDFETRVVELQYELAVQREENENLRRQHAEALAEAGNQQRHQQANKVDDAVVITVDAPPQYHTGTAVSADVLAEQVQRQLAAAQNKLAAATEALQRASAREMALVSDLDHAHVQLNQLRERIDAREAVQQLEPELRRSFAVVQENQWVAAATRAAARLDRAGVAAGRWLGATPLVRVVVIAYVCVLHVYFFFLIMHVVRASTPDHAGDVHEHLRQHHERMRTGASK